MSTDESTTNVRSIRAPDVETIQLRAGRARDRLFDAQAVISCIVTAAAAQCEDGGNRLDPAEIRRAYYVAHAIFNEVIDAIDETVIAKTPNEEERAEIARRAQS